MARPQRQKQSSAAVSSSGTQMLWLRLVYFFVYASFATTSVYRTLYFRRVGLTGAEIGTLIALQPLVTLIAGPAWSLIADRFHLRSRLLTLVSGMTIVPMLAMIWCQSFAGLIALVALHSFFLGPIQPLLDSSALALLGRDSHKYAHVRAFGSMGYAPVNWLTGLLVQGHDIRRIFVANAILMGVGALLTLRLAPEKSALSASIGRGLGQLVRDRWWLLFMLMVFVAMMAQTVGFSYTALYLDTLGASESLIGFSGTLGSVAQTLLLLSLLPWLLRRWGSERLLLATFAVYIVRFGLTALAGDASVIVAVQALHGFTFGGALIACVQFADRHAPPGMKTTSQALVTGLVSGLGRSAGGIVGGTLFEVVGPAQTFGICGIGMAVAFCCAAMMTARLKGRSSPETAPA